MKSSSKLLSAVSAVAISTGVIGSSAIAMSIATATVAEAAVVSRIVVRGNSRVDSSTVRSNLTISPGTRFGNDDIDDSVKRLFNTGLFADVRIAVSGASLVVNVTENDIVNQVVFNGNRKIKDRALQNVVQTRALGPYNDILVQADIQAIKDAYAAIGRSDATVTTRTVAVDDGRVNIAFEVNEGDRTKIGSINFVGNSAFGDGRLADIVQTKRSSFLSFLSRRDVYDQDKLLADEELLRRFYYNHGYADFRVISSFADLDEANNEYTITFTIEEGERYTFGDITVDSTVPGIDADNLRRQLKTRSGRVYSAENVEKTIIGLSERVAEKGFPFAQVTPRGSRDFENRTISVNYLIDEGTRAYIERIIIRGNSRTRDYVIRREFDISEGDPFNQILVQRAKRRLDALGFFDSVDISTRPGSEPDRVILVVDVRDRSTGEFSVGAGYSTGGSGPSVEISVTERNFLGRGQFIRVAAGGGQKTRDYNLSFTEPYFLGYRLAAGFDVFRRTNTSNANYNFDETGGSLRIAAPITEELSAKISYNYNETTYSDVKTTSLSLPYQNAFTNATRRKSSLDLQLTYDTLDDRSLPREGIFARGGIEYAGLGGDTDFVKFTGKASYFHTLMESADVIGNVSVSAGHMIATNGSVSVLDQFQIGGETIRGFDNQGIGPRDSATGDALGGTTYFAGSVEASFPMPGIPREVGLRGAVFADAGTLYGSALSSADLTGLTVNGTDTSFRASVGASIIWASPFGPLRFDYAWPVEKQPFDDIQNFRFGASTRF